MAKWGHTFKSFFIIIIIIIVIIIIAIIIKTPFHLLNVNKRTNKKYIRDSNFGKHFVLMKVVF